MPLLGFMGIITQKADFPNSVKDARATFSPFAEAEPSPPPPCQLVSDFVQDVPIPESASDQRLPCTMAEHCTIADVLSVVILLPIMIRVYNFV